MFRQEYEQVYIEAEGMKVILEFPPEQPESSLDESGCMKPKEIQQIKKEIKEIVACELEAAVKQKYNP